MNSPTPSKTETATSSKKNKSQKVESARIKERIRQNKREARDASRSIDIGRLFVRLWS